MIRTGKLYSMMGKRMPAHAALVMKISMRIRDYVVHKLRGTWIHYVFNKLRSLRQRVMRRSDGEDILLQRYVRVHGKHLNLTNPRNFTEKLFCRMISLNRRQNPNFMQLSDKYTARTYVCSKVGEQHVVKLLWHGTTLALSLLTLCRQSM